MLTPRDSRRTIHPAARFSRRRRLFRQRVRLCGVTPCLRSSRAFQRATHTALHAAVVAQDEKVEGLAVSLMATSTDPEFVRRLASVLLIGPWNDWSLHRLAWFACPDDRPLVAKTVEKVWEQFAALRPTLKSLIAFLNDTIAAEPHDATVRTFDVRRPRMKSRWPVPKLATAGKLAAWLGVPIGRLDWLADLKGLTLKRDLPKLRHYVNVRVPRRRGKPRLLEVPKPRLKAIQRRILHEILDQIPPHNAAHGFRVRRSIVSFV